MLTQRLILTFHQIVSEETGNDVTLARAKTMIALAGLTWPELGLAVTPSRLPRGRIFWRSEELDTLSIGGAFRRDPVGEDAPIIIDRVDPEELVMPEKMRECAAVIPLFGRRRLERFDLTLAEIFSCRQSGSALPAPGSAAAGDFRCEQEYGLLYDWLRAHRAIGALGEWRLAKEEDFDRPLQKEVS
jgi:hypothetical protein